MFRFFKNLHANREKVVEEKIGQWNGPLEEQKVQAVLEENIAISKKLFEDMDIIRFREIQPESLSGRAGLRYFLIFCDGMVSSDVINNNIVRALMQNLPASNPIEMNALLRDVVQVGEAKSTDSFKTVIESVTSGDTVLFAEGCTQAAILNTKQFALRSIAEPDSEKVLAGPREGFTESLMQNLSQVVRRVRTNELKTKMLTIGRRTCTPVCVCYIDDIVDKNVLADLVNRLERIDMDGILDSHYLAEQMRDQPYSMFRVMGSTERPDAVVGKLLEGRIAVFVEGSPMVLTAPYLFIENFQSSEDYYFNFYYSSFSRILRICAFILTMTIPGIFISIVAFHQEMLPYPLLIRLALERQSVPLPAAVEAVIMLIVFDILRETGVRMPSNIGQALSIVGALVIGQASVEANLIGAAMIIVVATTGITALLVPKLSTPIIFWRMLILFLSATLGFFGLTIGCSLLIIRINNLTSLGIEQISLTGKFNPQHLKDIWIRAPWPMMTDRPDLLTDNVRRQSKPGGGKDA